MPSYDGKRITLDGVILRLLGIEVLVEGTIEILDIRRRVDGR
jgi:hypothetical protein